MEKNQLINIPIKYSTKISISPTSIHKLNPEFSLCDIDVMYIDENRNGTDISREVVEDAIYSLYGVPIVGEWLEDENRFGDHGEKIEIMRDKITCTITTKPIGFVTKDAVDNAEWIEKPLPNGHELKTWLRLSKCILWTGRYEESQSIIDNGTFQSMEVKFLDGEYKQNGYFKPSKMIFSALCAIGVEPCFEESNIRRAGYELDSFKLELQTMLDKYKKLNLEPNKEEKKFMDLKKFTEILSAEKIGESDACKYRLLNVTDSKVFALDMEDYKPYGFDYAVTTEGDTENIVVDFDSKAEMSLSAIDKITDENFEEFSIKSVIDAMAEQKTKENTSILETEFNNKMEELKTAYEDLSTSYSVAMKKIEEYEAKENEVKAETHRNEVTSLFEKYSEKLGKCAEFLVYKAKCNPDEVTLDEVNEKLTLMVGKFMMESNTKKNFSYNPTETGVTGRRNETTENKYGHLLDKYIK